MFWSVGPFWYMVYGIWYVVYVMKMAFTVYSHMIHVCQALAAYNVVHQFLVININLKVFMECSKLNNIQLSSLEQIQIFWNICKHI